MSDTVTKWTIELNAEPRVRMFDPASPAEAVAPYRQAIMAGVGAVVGFFAALLGFIFIRFLWRKLTAAPQALEGSNAEASGARPPLRPRKWALPLLLALLCGGACAALGWFLFRTKYESTASLLVHANEPTIWMHSETEIDFQTYKRNQVAMIKSPLVLNKSLEDKSLLDNAILKKSSADQADWLAESLIVDIDNGELVRVSLRDENPEGIAEIVNAVVASYMKEVVDKERTDKLNHLDNLSKKLSDFKQQLHDKQQQLYIMMQTL